MNVTDVGHLVGDQDMGEDKMEKGAAREGKTAWEIADYYFEQCKKDFLALNIIEPAVWCKATDYITEQIDLIKVLEEKGYTYQTSDGVYYDTSKFADYNKLSHLNLDELKEGARVERNDEKKIQPILPCGSFHQKIRSDKWNGNHRGVKDFLVGILNVRL